MRNLFALQLTLKRKLMLHRLRNSSPSSILFVSMTLAAKYVGQRLRFHGREMDGLHRQRKRDKTWHMKKVRVDWHRVKQERKREKNKNSRLSIHWSPYKAQEHFPQQHCTLIHSSSSLRLCHSSSLCPLTQQCSPLPPPSRPHLLESVLSLSVPLQFEFLNRLYFCTIPLSYAFALWVGSEHNNVMEEIWTLCPPSYQFTFLYLQTLLKKKKTVRAPQRPSVLQQTSICASGWRAAVSQLYSVCNFLKEQKAKTYKLISPNL